MDESGLTPMMSVESVAAYFRVSPETVRRCTEDGWIDTVVLPASRTLRFREAAVQSFADSDEIVALRRAGRIVERRAIAAVADPRIRRLGTS